MKTLADLKRRLQVGAVYYLVYSSTRPTPVVAPEWRRVSTVHTNAIYANSETMKDGKGGFLAWPKASEFFIVDGGWEFRVNGGVLRYSFIGVKVGDWVAYRSVLDDKKPHFIGKVRDLVPDGIPSCREPMLMLEGKSGVVLATHCLPMSPVEAAQ